MKVYIGQASLMLEESAIANLQCKTVKKLEEEGFNLSHKGAEYNKEIEDSFFKLCQIEIPTLEDYKKVISIIGESIVDSNLNILIHDAYIE